MTFDELTKAIAGARERDARNYSDSYIDTTDCYRDRRALLAVIDQLLPDAMRYQWLRQPRDLYIECQTAWGWIHVAQNFQCTGRVLKEADCDAAIDRAIEGER